jgi:hypothetical protein
MRLLWPWVEHVTPEMARGGYMLNVLARYLKAFTVQVAGVYLSRDGPRVLSEKAQGETAHESGVDRNQRQPRLYLCHE